METRFMKGETWFRAPSTLPTCCVLRSPPIGPSILPEQILWYLVSEWTWNSRTLDQCMLFLPWHTESYRDIKANRYLSLVSLLHRFNLQVRFKGIFILYLKIREPMSKSGNIQVTECANIEKSSILGRRLTGAFKTDDVRPQHLKLRVTALRMILNLLYSC